VRAVLIVGLLLFAGVAAADADRARQNYLLHCMGCHGEDGLGLEGRVPSFRNTLARISASPQGRDYVLRVPGVTQATLDDAQTAEVLNWVLVQFSATDAARRVAPFTAAEVARARQRPLLDVGAARGAALDTTE
jgi:mono/diheme cytochrome c family protein